MFAVMDIAGAISEGVYHSSRLPIFESITLLVAGIALLAAFPLLIIDLWVFYGPGGKALYRAISARQTAQHHLINHQYPQAALAFEAAGQDEAAADAWLRSNDFTKAALYLSKLGYFNRAVSELAENGQGQAAARMYEDAGRGIDAAYEYERAGIYPAAARIFISESRYYDAARNLGKNGQFLEASQYYEHVGAAKDASKAMLNHLSILTSEDQYSSQELAPYRLKAAELLEEAGDYADAAQIFEDEGSYERAAQNYRSAQMLRQASELYRRAGNFQLAADLQDEIGDQEKALITRAEAFVGERKYREAADLFAQVNEPLRAAQYYEKGQFWELAGTLYKKAGHLDLAQAAYATAGDYAEAASIAEERRDYANAAKFYREAGDLDAQVRIYQLQGNLSQSAKVLLEMRRLDEADRVITKMKADDPNAIASLEELGDILRERGRNEDAYSRYRAAVGNRPVGPDTIELYSKMAAVLIEADELASANSIVEKILMHQPDHSPSIELLSLIDKRRSKKKKKGPNLAVPTEKSGKSTSKSFFGESNSAENRYEIISEIARGGMGVVYRARDIFLDRIVALKLLNETFAENEVAIQYFVREARAAAALNHPGIVTIFDVGQQQGHVFMAMELIDGTTLKQYIRHKGILSEPQVVWIIMQCCAALEYAHSRGIIHRDIKSGNVMLTRSKSLKIMDFGLAKAIQNHQGDHTQLIGTPYYMSPEQVSGVNVDFRSDLYSLGCMIYECATGRVPFKEGEPAYHHVHTPPVPPKERNPELSDGLNAFILKLLEKNPDDRFQNAAECLEAAKGL